MARKDFDEIQWPEKKFRPGDPDEWRRRKAVVRLLCEMGTIVKWQNGAKDTGVYTHMPLQYMIEGVIVAFLPDWGAYKVGSVTLAIPSGKVDVLRAIYAVQTLQRLGLK